MIHHHAPAVLAAALLFAPLALAQENPPPWWRVNDEVTVSLAFDFDTGVQPTLQVVPSWYNASITLLQTSPNVTLLPTFMGHTGVLGLVGTGAPISASIDLKVDNDPHIDWIKIFWFQFDAFEGSSGKVAAQIQQDLVKYGRASVTQKSEPIGTTGWNRVTIDARLVPQPDDEKMLWTLLENAFGTEAIDNLFVNSKCVKPGDEKGKAMGDVEGLSFDLLAATSANCRAAAVTEGPGPGFVRSYWVSSVESVTGSFHRIFRLNQAGSVTTVTTLPDTVAQAPLGAQDLTVETVQISPGVFQQFVYALVDRRPAGGNVVLVAIDTTGALVPTRNVTLVAFPPIPPQQFGLAFDPSGNLGLGTFWVSDTNGSSYEFDRSGNLVETRAIPTGVVGLGYDSTFGNFYGFSQQPRPTPAFGVSQINGYEWSAYDFQPTGVEFCGDLRISNPLGTAGGIASGFEAYRRANGELRLVTVVRLTNTTKLYEMAGPFRYGFSQMGTCGMSGGPAFEGSPTFAVTLSGVPDALLAVLYAGFSNDTYLGLPLPGPLLGAGMPESYLSISPDVTLGTFPPSAPGQFSHAIGLPPAGGLSYVPLFFQWLVLDPTVPGFLATSQAGKTVAY